MKNSTRLFGDNSRNLLILNGWHVGAPNAVLGGMTSKFEYPDPGTDPAYCDGLTAFDDDAPEPPRCLWCGEPIDDAYAYCSALCACYAERDSFEER